MQGFLAADPSSNPLVGIASLQFCAKTFFGLCQQLLGVVWWWVSWGWQCKWDHWGVGAATGHTHHRHHQDHVTQGAQELFAPTTGAKYAVWPEALHRTRTAVFDTSNRVSEAELNRVVDCIDQGYTMTIFKQVPTDCMLEFSKQWAKNKQLCKWVTTDDNLCTHV